MGLRPDKPEHPTLDIEVENASNTTPAAVQHYGVPAWGGEAQNSKFEVFLPHAYGFRTTVKLTGRVRNVWIRAQHMYTEVM